MNIIKKIFDFDKDNGQSYLVVKELDRQSLDKLKDMLTAYIYKTGGTGFFSYVSRAINGDKNNYFVQLVEEVCLSSGGAFAGMSGHGTLESVKAGLLISNGKIETIHLNNPDNDADTSQFILWYRGLLDLLDEVKKRFGVVIELKDLWGSSIVSAVKDLSSVMLSAGALALSAHFYKTKGVLVGDATLYNADDRLLIGGLAGGSLGLATSAWRHWGRRTLMKRRLWSMGLYGGFG